MTLTWEEIQERNARLLRPQQESPAIKAPATPLAPQQSGMSWEDIQTRSKSLIDNNQTKEWSGGPPTLGDIGSGAKRGAIRLAGQAGTAVDQAAQGMKNYYTGFLFAAMSKETRQKFQDNPEMRNEFLAATYKEVWKQTGVLGGAVAAIGLEEDDETRGEREKIVKTMDDFVSKHGDYSAQTKKATAESRYWDPAYIAEKGMVDVGGQLATAVGLNAMTGGSAAGLGFLSLIEAGGARREAMERMKQKAGEEGVDFDRMTAEAKANGEALITGGAAYLFERLPFRFFGVKPSKAVKDVAKKSIGRRLLQESGRFAGGTGGEALEEVATMAAGDVARYMIEDDPAAFDEFGKRAIETAILGGFGGTIGATVSLGGRAAGNVSDAQRKKVGNIADQIYELSKTEPGRAALQELASKENPSRKDIQKAGLKTTLRMKASQRKAVAEAAQVEVLDTAHHMVKKVAGDGVAAIERSDDKYDIMIKAAENETVEEIQGPQTDLGQQITDARGELATERRVDSEEGRQQKLDATEKQVGKLTNRRRHLREAAAAARVKGDADAADAYDRLATEAGKEIKNISTILQESENPYQAPPSDTPSQQGEIDPVEHPVQPDSPVAQEQIVKDAETTSQPQPDVEKLRDALPPGKKTNSLMDSVGLLKPGDTFSWNMGLGGGTVQARGVVDGRVEVEYKGQKYTVDQDPTTPTMETQRPADIVTQAPIIEEEGGFAKLPTKSIAEMFGGIADVVFGPVGAKRVKGLGKRLKGMVISDVNPDIHMAEKLMDRRLARKSREVQQGVVDYQSGALKAAKLQEGDAVPDHLAHLADQYMKGNIELQDLPEAMRSPTKALRESIDSLSREALNSGAITGGKFLGSVQARSEFFDQLREGRDSHMTHEDMVSWIMTESKLKKTPIKPSIAGTIASVIRNEGLYLTRTYDAFEDADWGTRMPKITRDNMANLLRNEDNDRRKRLMKINNGRKTSGKTPIELGPAITEDQIQQKMSDILHQAETAGDMRTFLEARKGRQNRNILKGRKNLPEQYRAFLGEVTDTVTNAIKTQIKLASLIQKHQMMQDIAKAGAGKFFWDSRDEVPGTGAAVQVAKEGDMAMDPVAGMWTTPEVAQMFENDAPGSGIGNTLYNAGMWIDTHSQRAKTAWSVQSHMRQVIGNPLMLMANGLNPLQGRTAVWAAEMRGKGTEEQRAYLNRAAELGLVGEGVEYGLFQRMFTKGAMEKMLSEYASPAGKAPKAWNQMADFLKKQYGFEDTYFKLTAWEGEKDRYRKTGMFEDTPDGENALEEYTADIVRRTNPTYSELPQLINTIRNVPGFGMFMAFPASQLVNAYHRAGLAIQELKDPNPRVKVIGAVRLVSQLAMYSAPYGAELATAAAFGISDEERKAFKKTLPTWARWAPIAFLKGNDKGKYRYINLGFIDPHSYFTQPIRALLQGVTENEFWAGMGRASMQIFEPYMQETMAATVMFDLMRNTTAYSSKIWKENDKWQDKAILGAQHAFRGTIEPGTLISAERIYKGYTGEISKGGKEYKLLDEAASALTGVKMENYDTNQAFGFAITDFVNGMRDVESVARGLNSEGTVSGTAGTVERADNLRETTMQKMHEDFENYRVASPEIDLAYLKYSLGSRRQSDDIIEEIHTGVFKKYQPTELRVMDRMVDAVADPDRKAELLELRKQKINDLSHSIGSTETDKNGPDIKRDVEVLKERGVTSQDAMANVVASIKRRYEESQFTKAMKENKKGYTELQVRNAVTQKVLKTGWKWSKSRENRVKRSGFRMGAGATDIANFIEEESRQW